MASTFKDIFQDELVSGNWRINSLLRLQHNIAVPIWSATYSLIFQ